MKINLVYEKGIKNANEDSYLIGDSIWGVFDGANSLNKYTDPNGQTGGQLASLIAKESFMPDNNSLKDMAIAANKKIDNEMKGRGIDISDKLNLWCTNLAVVRKLDEKLEWIQLADTAIVFIYNDLSYKVITTEELHDKETLMKWSELAKSKTENIRKILDEQIRKVRKNINISYGFLTGEKEMENFIKEGIEDLKNIKHVILLTDGFTIPQKDPLIEYPWNDFVDKYLEGGIEGLKTYIRNIENADPNCWEYPRQKKHDDITAISVTF